MATPMLARIGRPRRAGNVSDGAPPSTAAAAHPPPVNEHFCRVCYDEASPEPGGSLLSPCNCRGSLAFIHESCLSEYLRVGPPTLHCRVCNARYTLPPGFELPPSQHEASEVAAERRREAEILQRRQRRQHPMTLCLALTMGGVALAAVGAAVFCAHTSRRHAQRHQAREEAFAKIRGCIMGLRHVARRRVLQADLLKMQRVFVQHEQRIQEKALQHEQRWPRRSVRTVRPSDLRRWQDRQEVQTMVEARQWLEEEAGRAVVQAKRWHLFNEKPDANRRTEETETDRGDELAGEAAQQHHQRRRGGRSHAVQQLNQHVAKMRQEAFEWELCDLANAVGSKEARRAAFVLRPHFGSWLDERPCAPRYRPGGTAERIALQEIVVCLLHLAGGGMLDLYLPDWEMPDLRLGIVWRAQRAVVLAGRRLLGMLPRRSPAA